MSLVLGGCGGSEGADPVPSARPVGFGSTWAEFLEPTAIEASFPLLAKGQVRVNVAWPASDVRSPALLDLAERGHDAGVAIHPWLLLSENEGYWPGSTNASRFRDVAMQWMDAWDERGLGPTTLIVDMELRKDRADQLSALLENDLAAGIELLKSGIDPDEYASATAIYRDLVETAHARGHRVHLTTLPQVIDDYADEDDGLRQALGIPVDGIAWDTLSFQAYRTLFGDLLGGTPSSFFVYSYGVDARERFGERAALDIGLVGKGVTESSVYASGIDLGSDLAACRAAGIPRERVVVYNLDGILERAPIAQWLLEDAGEPVPPAEDAASLSIRNKVALLDGLL